MNKGLKELQKAKERFLMVEQNYTKYATKNMEAIRLESECEDIRPPFFRDIDRIIYALSYTRYIDKTQVYSFKDNDHISKRIIHVQLVSKIARTIARALGLNADLVEAISLGHDIGHTPLGHSGEAMLNEISQKELGEYFCHNVQSVRNYMFIENRGKGLNLTIQTLDGILCHNGEEIYKKYEPVRKTKEDVVEQYYNCYKDKTYNNKFPMTLEGCIVRISDVIAYAGRDIDDALNLGLIDKKDIPIKIKETLGDSNKKIINTIVNDIIINSTDHNYIEMSDNIYNALKELIEFNYKYIYNKSLSLKDYEYYKKGMYRIYQVYLEAIRNNNKDNIIFKIFLDLQDDLYLKNTSDERKVLDFIAGMTDDFFLNQVKLINNI